VEIEFKIYVKNDERGRLDVIADFPGVSFKEDFLHGEEQNRWYTYKNTFTYSKEMWRSLKKNRNLQVYIFNRNKLEGYIDDIELKVKTINK